MIPELLRSPPSQLLGVFFLAACFSCLIWRVKDFFKFQAIDLLSALVRITGLNSSNVSAMAQSKRVVPIPYCKSSRAPSSPAVISSATIFFSRYTISFATFLIRLLRFTKHCRLFAPCDRCWWHRSTIALL